MHVFNDINNDRYDYSVLLSPGRVWIKFLLILVTHSTMLTRHKLRMKYVDHNDDCKDILCVRVLFHVY